MTKITANYAHFILMQWQEIKPAMQEIYGGFNKFSRYYAASHGFSDWLDTLKGQTLTQWQTEDVATAYAKYALTQPYEIPGKLAYLCRQYNVELPAIEGILTPAYWVAIAERENWQVFYQPQTQAA